MPREEEMLPKDKYTIFDRKEKRYRKGLHSESSSDLATHILISCFRTTEMDKSEPENQPSRFLDTNTKSAPRIGPMYSKQLQDRTAYEPEQLASLLVCSWSTMEMKGAQRLESELCGELALKVGCSWIKRTPSAPTPLYALKARHSRDLLYLEALSSSCHIVDGLTSIFKALRNLPSRS